MTETPQRFDLETDQADALGAAAAAVREGECVVLPTDTVYGIGSDAFSAKAVSKLLEVKQRGEDMPPPVLIAEPSMLRAFTQDVPQSAKQLAEKFWPGALTIILKAQAALGLQLGDTGGTVAVRVPDNDHARALLRRTGPMAVSSANISGQPPATTCDEAQAALGNGVAVYLDGGSTPGLVSSTIIDFTRFRGGQVVREGALGFEELKQVARRLRPLAQPEPEETEADQGMAELEAPHASGTDPATAEDAPQDVPQDAAQETRETEG